MEKAIILKRFIIVLICFMLLTIFSAFAGLLGTSAEATHSGEITVILETPNGTVLERKSIDFYAGDNLLDLLVENFEVEYTEFAIGVMITKIGDLAQDEVNSMYISFYIDNTPSTQGVSSLSIYDGMVLEFTLIQY